MSGEIERMKLGTCIGIDPGLDGGIVALNGLGHIIYAHAMPTNKMGTKRGYNVPALKGLLHPWANVFIEKQQARPGQGVTSMFGTGYGYGLLLGLLAGLNVPYSVVSPGGWQRTMFAGLPADARPKEKSIIVAQRLWPAQDWRRSDRARKPHDGMTDAALIAEFGRRSLAGGV